MHMEEKDIDEVTRYVNTVIVTRLNPEQCAILMACMTQWADEHPSETEAIQTLKSIEFVRER